MSHLTIFSLCEFFSKLDSCSSEGGVLEQALNGELYDEARMERLRRMER